MKGFISNQINVINTLILAIGSYSTFLTPLVLFPILAERLGPKQFGSFSTILALSSVAFVICEGGTSNVAVRHLTPLRIDVLRFQAYVSAIYIIRLATFAIFSFTFSAYCIFVLSQDFKNISIILLAAFAGTTNSSWCFHAAGVLHRSTLTSSITRLAAIPLAFFVVKPNSGGQVPALLLNATLLAGSLLNIVDLMRLGLLTKERTEFSLVKRILKESFPMLVSASALSLFVNSPIVALNTAVGSEAAGYYSIADKLVKLFHQLAQPFNQLVFRGSLLRIQSETFTINYIKKLFLLYILTTLLYIVTLLFFGKIIIITLFGGRYLGAYAILLNLIFTLLVTVPSSITSSSLLLARGLTMQYGITVTIIGFSSIPIFNYFATSAGVTGVIVSQYLIESVIFLMLVVIYLYSKHQLD